MPPNNTAGLPSASPTILEMVSSPSSLSGESTPSSAGDVVPLAQTVLEDEDSDAEEHYVVSADDPPAPRLTAKTCYTEKRMSKSVLMGMCYGLSNDGRKLGDLSLEPYASSNKKKMFTPSVKQLCLEIVRQAAARLIKAPRSSHYTKERCYKWLMLYPLAHPNDVAFLVREELRFKAEVEEATNEVRVKKSANWVDNDPFLRLYHCLINDKVKAAFLTRDNVLNREELDARNSDQRPKTYEQEAAELFNNTAFAPTSLHLPSLHSDFDQAKLLRLEDMPGAITPEEVKSRMADSRAKLMVVISNWELSSNGFGQRTKEDDGFGCLEEEHLLDDNRGAFLKGFRSHILYLWHLSNEEDILQSVKSVLDPGCAANTDSVPDVDSKRKKRKSSGEDERNFREQVSSSFDTISFSTLCNQITQTQKSKADFEVKSVLATDDVVKAVYHRMMHEADATIKTLKARLNKREDRAGK
jgi:hypothetical protein